MKNSHPILLLVLASMIAFTNIEAYTISSFGPALWGTSNATIGVAGYAIEDFENTTLIQGLSYQVFPDNGLNTGLKTVLPALLNPNSDPINGGAFIGGNWDGSYVLANSVNQTYTDYGSSNPVYGANFHNITFYFENGATSIGFSIQQMGGNSQLSINGVVIGNIFTLAPNLKNTDVTFGTGGRNGYIRIDAVGNELIQSFAINNTLNDGYAIDHLAVQFAIPEPSSLVALLLASLSFCGYAFLKKSIL